MCVKEGLRQNAAVTVLRPKKKHTKNKENHFQTDPRASCPSLTPKTEPIAGLKNNAKSKLGPGLSSLIPDIIEE